MPSGFLKGQWEEGAPFLLICALFFIPLSSSLKSIFIILAAVALLITPVYRQVFLSTLKEDWCKATFLFFVIALVACIWSPASSHARLLFIEKYSKLLYLPLFAAAFQNPVIRRIGISAFLGAMLLTCFVIFFKQLQHLETPERLFHDHISTGCMMALAAYLSGLMAFNRQGLLRLLFLSQTLLFSYQLIFVNTGRIGYIIYFALMILLLIQMLPWKYLIIGVASFSVLFFICGYQSPSLQNRLQVSVLEWNKYQQGEKVTSIGMRLVFHQYAKSLFLSSPLIGHGTGSFSHYYQQVNTAPDYSNVMEPHSQYWLVASEFGLVGLLALLYFFSSLIRNTFRMQDMKAVMLGVLVCFLLSNISDSQLLHSDMGYLFIVFSALCLSELVENRASSPRHLTSNLKKSSFYRAAVQ